MENVIALSPKYILNNSLYAKTYLYIFFVLLRLTEDQWVAHETRLPVTRELMMVSLQNVQRIFIRATGKIIE
mgnify:CR=1 FL=1